MRRSSFSRMRGLVWTMSSLLAMADPGNSGSIDCGDPDPVCTFFVRSGAAQPIGPCAGRTPAMAFPTVEQGAAALVNGGEVVCVEAGVYVEGDVTPGSGGTPSFPVVIRAVGEVVMRPPGDANTDCSTIPTTGFLLLGRQYVTIEGFDFEGYCDAGIQVRSNPQETVNSRGITLRSNRVSGTRFGRGIDVAGEGTMSVVDNVVVANRGSGISLQGCIRSPDAEPKCMRATTVPISGTISGNRVADNTGHGIFVRGASATRIENNQSYGNGGGGLQVNASSDTLIFNNLFFANQADGVRVGAPDRGTPAEPLAPTGSPQTRIVNNTIYGNGEWGIEIGENDAGSPGASVLNNIVQNNGLSIPDDLPGEIGVLNESVGLPSTCGYVAGFNLVRNAGDRNYGPSTPSNVYDLHSDARFVDPTRPDGFRLRAGSPAIDAGYESVAVVQISGSATAAGGADVGRADLGFHYDAVGNGTPQIDSTIMPIFVRVDGSDDNARPTSPAAALASIGRAVRDFARAGTEVVVGPGTYREGQISARSDQPPGSYAIRADASGRRTGEMPGNVRVVADCGGAACDNGFIVRNTCNARIEGFQVTGSREAGILIADRADGAVVAHNQIFDNLQRGIQVVNAGGVRIFDNLVYDNGAAGSGGGIQIGGRCPGGEPDCTTAGSRDAEITFNTVVGNEVNGVLIGAGAGDSSGATFRFNISIDNLLGNAIQVGNSRTRDVHLVGLEKGFNVLDSFSDLRETDLDYDYFWPDLGEPLFVNAAAARFELDPAGIAAIDRAEILTARQAGLDVRSTRVDRAPDAGVADLGYHYPILDVELTGDCNGNGVVSVAELVTGVNMALGLRPAADCPAFDADDDGEVEINELIAGVNNALLDT
jgi:parallel beta-helix repeat protein